MSICVTINEETKSISEWARTLGISTSTANRLYHSNKLKDYVLHGPDKSSNRSKRSKKVKEGTVIGRLTVLEILPEKSAQGYSIVRCKCECGNECNISIRNLTKKKPTLSCGCLQKDVSRRRNIKDLTGMTFGDLKVIGFAGVINRYACWEVEAPNGKRNIVRGSTLRNGTYVGTFAKKNEDIPNNKLGKYYIRYFRMNKEYESWSDFEQWALKNGYTEDTVCRRYDASKPYTKNNTYFEQKRSIVTVNGEKKNLSEWARVLGISRERTRQLNNQDRLEDYIVNRTKLKPGRPSITESKFKAESKNILESLDKPKNTRGTLQR